ncbi:SDR family NAD(P)-dependent oxidoreductase [Paenibacillus sp. CC-CFT747]|nr:SDR family NAD(P)-dependent oxidoreductase [Paenibacillus sp. CC-CFT747]
MDYLSDIKEKRIVVTGGSKGIGREIALAFARLGATVTISGRKEEDLARTSRELQAFNPLCHSIVSDISDVAGCYATIDEAFSRMGGWMYW